MKKSHNQNIPKKLAPWLHYPGSFMQRLKDHGVKNAAITVLQSAWQIPTREEKFALGLFERQFVLVREVLISSGKTHWMYARTVVPWQTIAKHPMLARLKTRSLGSILFKDPDMERSPFEIFCLHPEMALYKKAKQANPKASGDLWARQSIFDLSGSEVLLIEVFFPKSYSKI